jgi:hypothetical protein
MHEPAVGCRHCNSSRHPEHEAKQLTLLEFVVKQTPGYTFKINVRFFAHEGHN